MADRPVNLQQVERFAHLTDSEVARLGSAGTYVTVPEDWSLVGADISTDRTYLLISGEASVRRQGKEIATLGPGRVFGSASVVGQPLRTATVVASTRLECLQLTAEQVEKLRSELPAFEEAVDEAASDSATW